jgi:hypothetical protein
VALRYLGFAQAALGRFREAGDSWERWASQSPKPPEEEAQAPAVDRARQAVLTLDHVLRSAHE